MFFLLIFILSTYSSTVPIKFICDKPALTAIQKIGTLHLPPYTPESLFSDIITEFNNTFPDLKLIPDFSELSSPLSNWKYECTEPSPIITRTLVASREYMKKGDQNIIFVFLCPDLVLGEFQEMAHKMIGECGSFVGVLHSAVEGVFRQRIADAVMSVVMRRLYRSDEGYRDVDRDVRKYGRFCGKLMSKGEEDR